jgi:hypothetical protein
MENSTVYGNLDTEVLVGGTRVLLMFMAEHVVWPGWYLCEVTPIGIRTVSAVRQSTAASLLSMNQAQGELWMIVSYDMLKNRCVEPYEPGLAGWGA